MSFLARMHKNPKHQQAEEALFIKRLRFKHVNELPTKADAINLMQQYVHLYQAMEERLNDFTEFAPLQFFATPPFDKRTALLRDDVAEMKSFLSREERLSLDDQTFVYPAIAQAIQRIKESNAIELFAVCSVRTLGDVFGGQHLNRYNQQVFAEDTLTGSFYGRVSHAQRLIGSFINGENLLTKVQEGDFFRAVDEVFQVHLDLFSEMEAKREQRLKTLPPKEENSMSQHLRFGLFGLGVVAAAAGVSVLAKSEHNPWSLGNN